MAALAPQQERLAWADTARGIGIILVVYGHALRGHMVSGAYDPAWQGDVQDAVIYAFHMPLFFFLAGLFAQRSLSRGTCDLLRDKSITLVYPYLLWSIISIGLGLLAASAVNNPLQANAASEIWRTPVYQYWFLYALLICHLVLFATRADWRITFSLTVLSAVLGSRFEFGIVTAAFGFYVYFGLGILLAPFVKQFSCRPAVLAGTIVVLVLPFALTFRIDQEALPPGMTVIRALLGIAAVIAVAMFCAPRARWLSALGMASMAIFVLHTFFSAGLRIALSAVGYSNDLVALMLGTVVGVVMPFLIWLIAQRYGMLPWLGLGMQPVAARGQSK